MSPDRPRRNWYKKELIFGNSPSSTLDKPTRGANEADERVDLEIILFGPKSRHLSDIDKLEPEKAYSSGPYFSEFDPFPPSNKKGKSEEEGPQKTPSDKSADKPKSSSSNDNRTNNGEKVKTRTVTDRTLDRMEKMYKDVGAGGSSAGNDTYVDYMDYF